MERLPSPARLLLGALLLLSPAIFGACHPAPSSPQDARILIIDPASGAEVPAGDVAVQVFVERFELVDMGDSDNVVGQGHIVYYMDVKPPLDQGETALTAEGTYATSIETSHTWSKVAPGEHTFWAQLVNNDDTPLVPPAAVRVDVDAAAQ